MAEITETIEWQGQGRLRFVDGVLQERVPRERKWLDPESGLWKYAPGDVWVDVPRLTRRGGILVAEGTEPRDREPARDAAPPGYSIKGLDTHRFRWVRGSGVNAWVSEEFDTKAAAIADAWRDHGNELSACNTIPGPGV